MGTRWGWGVVLVVATGCGAELAESEPQTAQQVERPRVTVEDVDENTVRAHFASTASPYIVEAAACSLHLRVDDTHVFDVQVGERRCATTPMPDEAIPVVVRAANHHVVLEATTAAEITPVWLRAVLPQIAHTLEDEVEAAHTSLRRARSTVNDPNHGIQSGGSGTAGIIFASVLGGVGLLVALIVAAVTTPNHNLSF
jgi:hypothetical protein